MTPAPAAENVQRLETPHGHVRRAPRAVYVYEWPIRIWHWVTALAIFLLALTGYFIGQPLHTITGEASDHYFNGLVRTVHFVSAYALAIGLLARTWWAIVGNRHSREIYWVPFYKLSYWKEVLQEVKWYALLKKVPAKYVGHNPLSRFSMFFMFMLGTLFLIVTGFGLYSEGTAADSWQRALFGWTIGFAGSSMTLRTWHHLSMYYILFFSMIHIYLAMREDIMGRTSMASTMISGWRMFRDDHTDFADDEDKAIRKELETEADVEAKE